MNQEKYIERITTLRNNNFISKKLFLELLKKINVKNIDFNETLKDLENSFKIYTHDDMNENNSKYILEIHYTETKPNEIDIYHYKYQNRNKYNEENFTDGKHIFFKKYDRYFHLTDIEPIWYKHEHFFIYNIPIITEEDYLIYNIYIDQVINDLNIYNSNNIEIKIDEIKKICKKSNFILCKNACCGHICDGGYSQLFDNKKKYSYLLDRQKWDLIREVDRINHNIRGYLYSKYKEMNFLYNKYNNNDSITKEDMLKIMSLLDEDKENIRDNTYKIISEELMRLFNK